MSASALLPRQLGSTLGSEVVVVEEAALRRPKTPTRREGWSLHARRATRSSRRGRSDALPKGDSLHVGPEPRLPTSLLFKSEPLTEDVMIAGQPFVHLQVKSSRPGGAITATLAALGPNFACGADGRPNSDTRVLATGGADLRFIVGT